MEEILEEAIVSAIRNLSLPSFVNLWGVTVLAALSACSVLKMLIIAGYLSVLKVSNWKRLLCNALMFVLGINFSYLLVEIIIIKGPSWMIALVPSTSILYLIMGTFFIMFGLVALGLIRMPISRIKVLSREEPDHDFLMGFLLGAIIVSIEALSCPTCNPALKLIAFSYGKQGPYLASLVFGIFLLGQSTMPFLAGLVLAPLKQLLAKNDNNEYVRITGAIALVLVGLDLLWLF